MQMDSQDASLTVPAQLSKLADASKWGGFVTITTRKGHCLDFISGPAGFLTASRKAERLSGSGQFETVARGTRCGRVPDTGKSRKWAFCEICVLEKF